MHLLAEDAQPDVPDRRFKHSVEPVSIGRSTGKVVSETNTVRLTVRC
jgi:hypothetical protein